MSEQVWNFPGIHAAIATLRGHGAALQGQVETLIGLLGQGQAAWSGSASDQWSVEQTRLNNHLGEFQVAFMDYVSAVEQATMDQEHTEAAAQASFA